MSITKNVDMLYTAPKIRRKGFVIRTVKCQMNAEVDVFRIVYTDCNQRSEEEAEQSGHELEHIQMLALQVAASHTMPQHRSLVLLF